MFKYLYLLILSGFAFPGLLSGQTIRQAQAADSSFDSLTIRFCARHHCDGTPISGVDVTLRLAYPGDDTLTLTEQAMGCRDFGPYPVPLSYTISVEKLNQPLNGLNALDLHRMANHILGIAPLPAPYGLVAADANRSLGVTTFDMVVFRGVMQGVNTQFPNNKSWIFIDQDYVFTDPNDPFTQPFPETITVADLSGLTDSVLSHNFTAIKIGDVDCSALPGLQDNHPEERTPARLRMPDRTLPAGATLEIPVYLDLTAPCVALQAELAFDPELLEVVDILPGVLPGDAAPVLLKAGSVNLLWYGAGVLEPGIPSEVCRLLVRVRQETTTRAAFRLDRSRIPAQAFGERSEAHSIALAFDAPAAEVAVFPNPGSADVSVLLASPSAEPAWLRVFDLRGMLLLERSFAAPGIRLPAEIFPGPGLYPYEIRQGDQAFRGRIVRM